MTEALQSPAIRNASISRRQNRAGPLSVPFAAGLLALAALCWAGNHIVARAVGGHVPAWSVNVTRWLLVAILIATFANRSLRADWPVIMRHWPILAFLGATGGGVFGALQFVGLKYTVALNVSLMNSVAPALIACAGYAIFRDRIGLRQVIGITISLLGVLAIVSRLDPVILATFGFNTGDLLVFFNMGLWAIYSACLRLRPPIALTSFLFTVAVSAAVVCAPFAILEYSGGARLAFDVPTLGAIAYSGLMSSLLAYMCWGRGVETLGVTRAGVFLHLVPLFGAILATSLLGERLGLHHLVGFALILAGVTLAVRAAPPVGDKANLLSENEGGIERNSAAN